LRDAALRTPPGSAAQTKPVLEINRTNNLGCLHGLLASGRSLFFFTGNADISASLLITAGRGEYRVPQRSDSASPGWTSPPLKDFCGYTLYAAQRDAPEGLFHRQWSARTGSLLSSSIAFSHVFCHIPAHRSACV